MIRNSQELHLSTYIQLPMTEHPSRKVMNFRHLLGCDTIVHGKIVMLNISADMMYLQDTCATVRVRVPLNLSVIRPSRHPPRGFLSLIICPVP